MGTKISMWDLSATGHYLFTLSDNLALYPLAGIGIMGITQDTDMDDWGDDDGWGDVSSSASTTEFGFNIGGGIDLKLSENLILNGQIKYMIISNFNRLIISAGLMYKF
jgi:outer membrane protein X